LRSLIKQLLIYSPMTDAQATYDQLSAAHHLASVDGVIMLRV